MIEKIPDQIPVQTGEWRGTTFDIIPKETFGMACRKINELCDIINDITDWIKRTDETIVKYGIKPIKNATNSKMENVAENSQSAKIAQGFKNLQELAKKAEKECRFNPVQADREVYKALTRSENVQELALVRKALGIAVDALKDNLSQANFTQMLDASRFHCIRTKCEFALAEITALEQKE